MISRTTEPMLMAPLEIEKWFFSAVFFPFLAINAKIGKNEEKQRKEKKERAQGKRLGSKTH